jgi:hypothetical protein
MLAKTALAKTVLVKAVPVKTVLAKPCPTHFPGGHPRGQGSSEDCFRDVIVIQKCEQTAIFTLKRHGIVSRQSLRTRPRASTFTPV